MKNRLHQTGRSDMLTRYDYIIGIDPDAEKSGFAVLQKSSRQFTDMATFAFPQLLTELQRHKAQCSETTTSLIVIVEASWLRRKTNYHVGDYGVHVAEKIAYRVGANHETGRKIVEMCKSFNIPVVEQEPLNKTWSGRDHKITHDELAYFVQLPKNKTNQEERDSALLAWNYAGFPIKTRTFSRTCLKNVFR